MQGEDNSDQELEVAEGLASNGSPKERRSLAKAHRELTPEELSSPVVQKFLMDEIDRLESEKFSLLPYRSKYHEADKHAAVLAEKYKRHVALEIISGGGLTVGALLLGFVPSVWSTQPLGLVLGISGVLLIGVGIVSKVVIR